MIGDRNLDNEQVEYKARRSDDKSLVNVNDVVAFIKGNWFNPFNIVLALMG